LKNRERMLIVSPNSGHDATIAADMITPLLTQYDVFVMGCLHPYFVGRDAGRFGNEAQVDTCLNAMQIIGLSQGGTIATVAMAVMAADAAKFGALRPKNLVADGSPIDSRVNPNDLCRIAKYSLVSPRFVDVPDGFAGAGRSVYWMPVVKDGQQQAMAAFDGPSLREKVRQPLTAEAINDTLDRVYRHHDLPCGTWMHHGRAVDVSVITDGVLTIEADADEVCPTAQTRKLLKLAKNAVRRQNVVVPSPHFSQHHVMVDKFG
jgi:poly(3-hydroxybutyrate) depolymerase